MENKTPKDSPKPTGKTPKFNLSWIYGIIILVLIGSYFMNDTSPSKEVPYSNFEVYVKQGAIERIDVFPNKNTLSAKVNKTALKTVFGDKSDIFEKERLISVRIPSVEEFSKFINKAKEDQLYSGVVDYKESRDYIELFLYSILPFLLLILFFVFMNRRMSGQMGGGGGIFNVGKSKAQLFDKGNVENKITFKDVAGLAGAKQEIEEIVAFLKNPSKYTELGGKIPKGALLVGPPGTGKTLLAKAVAGEAGCAVFLYVGLRFCGNVCRCRCFSSTRFIPSSQGKITLYHFYR